MRVLVALLLVAATGSVAFAEQRDVAERALMQALSERLTLDAIAQATGVDGNFAVALRIVSLEQAASCLAVVPDEAPFSSAVVAAAADAQRDYLTPLRDYQIGIDRREVSIRSYGWAHIRCMERFSPDVPRMLNQHFDGASATAKRAYREYAQRHPSDPWSWRALSALESQNPSPAGTAEAIEAAQRYLALTASSLDRAEAHAILGSLYVRRDMSTDATRHAQIAMATAEQALREDARNAEWLRLLVYANLSLSTVSWNSALPSALQDAQHAVSVSEQYAQLLMQDIEAQCLLSKAYFNLAGVLGVQSDRGATYKARSDEVARAGGFYGNHTRCPDVVMLRGDRTRGRQIELSP